MQRGARDDRINLSREVALLELDLAVAFALGCHGIDPHGVIAAFVQPRDKAAAAPAPCSTIAAGAGGR